MKARRERVSKMGSEGKAFALDKWAMHSVKNNCAYTNLSGSQRVLNGFFENQVLP